MSSKWKMISVVVLVTTLALAGVLLSACSIDSWVEVEPGEYAILQGGLATDRAAGHGIETLRIDRDARQVVLTQVEGSQIVDSFVPRDRSEWPSGCPSNINSTRMEVLDIAGDSLTVGAVIFNHPVLVRDCPSDPVRIVLRGDGAIGGGGGACPYPEPCIYFAPQSTVAP